LNAQPFPPGVQNDSASPLRVGEIGRLKPLVIAELNRRGEHLGDRLEALLANGLEESSYVCPQNAVTLLGWLSLPMAVIAIGSMLVRPRSSGSTMPVREATPTQSASDDACGGRLLRMKNADQTG